MQKGYWIPLFVTVAVAMLAVAPAQSQEKKPIVIAVARRPYIRPDVRLR